MRMKELSTAKKREGIAAQLAEIARSLNATCQREEAIFNDRKIYLRLRYRLGWVVSPRKFARFEAAMAQLSPIGEL